MGPNYRVNTIKQKMKEAIQRYGTSICKIFFYIIDAEKEKFIITLDVTKYSKQFLPKLTRRLLFENDC
jgi:hypothetical protein